MNEMKKMYFLVIFAILFLVRVQHKTLTRARVHFFKPKTIKMDELTEIIVDQPADPPSDAYAFDVLLRLAMESDLEFKELKQAIMKTLPARQYDYPIWLNNYQAMRMLNVSSATIKRLRQRKLIRFIKVNGYCRYHIDELLRLIEYQKRNNVTVIG